MALIVDPQPNFKHFCKICKKGFVCGRALGGHMRAHGIGDENGQMDDEDQASDWEDKLGGGGEGAASNVPPNIKRMYALRTNPNRLKSCRVCENCGEEFLSWKSFLEHGKCSTSEDAESLVSSPRSDGEDGTATRGCGGWYKRRRSLRAKVGNFVANCPSNEEEYLANCLMMLSNTNVDPFVAEPEESCASASKEEERIRNPMNLQPPNLTYNRAPLLEHKAKGVANKGLFECKACKKVFNSHQALGGHRASHKKVKGCFAARFDQGLDDSVGADEDAITHIDDFLLSKSTSTFDRCSLPYSNSKKPSKIHECSICHRVFSTGQALGGHKRCHWITSNSPDPSTSMAMANKLHQLQDHLEQIQQRPKFTNNFPSDHLDLTLDLNLPAQAEDQTRSNQRDAPTNPSFEVSTENEFFLQAWAGGVNRKGKGDNNHRNGRKDNNVSEDNNMNDCVPVHDVGDDVDNKMKLAKLSELKDLEVNGSSSLWLQVGIGSTTDQNADP